ncbi:EutP/PduV family microcompartment system protein [Mesobacillus subterraneus]|uniref:EutP/PduV family microcompartment system protein n=1 Tax=Mesobacillus subterraneus TaxID=285983 RepID=UPI00203ECA8D|nr:EutP/PduV family microcompartment system protein [Mesobacillus subterraneus]MCM3572297.1 EutP/PduV family microcompartment system protein [Mesobacillus subterraneus]
MAKQNRAMLIGAIGAGKSTLTNKLLGREVQAVKTQSLIYRDWIVDTPGEYTENPLFYKNIMATALEVTHVLYLQDSTKKKTIFPPGFATGINKIPIGVVTKSDAEEANVNLAVNKLRAVIPKGIIIIASAVNGQGIEEIRKLVQCHSLQETIKASKEMDPNIVLPI